MTSGRIAMRLVQTALILVLGFGGTGAVAESSIDEDWCPSQACGPCPADWHGSCYAGIEGCSEYGCWNDGECTRGGTTTYYQCYCDPCAEG
jgi:hypothetical protein